MPGTAGGPTLAIIGHIDEIGLIVTHIDDQGYLYFVGVGGWDAQILVGQRVEVATRDGVIPGVVGKKPIHLLKDEERKKVAEMKDLHIDIGAKDGDEAAGLVRIGDVAVIAGARSSCPTAAPPRGRWTTASAATSPTRRRGSWPRPAARPGDVVAVAAVQEEITFGGSRTTAYALDPDLAIVVDVTHATDAPGVDPKELGKHQLGSGPVIERGSILNPRIFELLHATAEEEGIPFTLAASAGRTGTDADAVHFSRAGVPCGLIGLPLRYMHSPVEVVDLEDVANAARLIAAFAQAPGAGHLLRAVSPLGPSRCWCCSTSTARCCSRPTSSTREALHAAIAQGLRHRDPGGPDRGGGPHGRRDRPLDPDAGRRAPTTLVSDRSSTLRARGLRGVRRPLPALAGRPRGARASQEVLAGLAARDDVRLSLVTGNLEPIARLKLNRAGIGHHFARGPGRVRLGLRRPRGPAADRAPPRGRATAAPGRASARS